MLHPQRLRISFVRLGALRHVKLHDCWISKKKSGCRLISAAAFSTGSSPHVLHRHLPHVPCSLVHVADIGIHNGQPLRTTGRRHSSSATAKLESTPSIDDDDAAYLQHLVALGSSASQLSDLASLEALLALPDVPVTTKTIGAKVIVAALEQRQQWALLPTLLSLNAFRRLAEVRKFEVGEQLFAALLRGQFTFASRRGGAAPDIFRTLDLAAKCKALDTPAVIDAVRAGYQSLGLESPARINELLDIGPTDPASLQRRAQPRERYNDADDPTSLGPIGSFTGRLNMGRFMGQIALARKTQSAYAVLPAVLAGLPQACSTEPKSELKKRQKILGAVCGRDVYLVSEVQGLARALGAVPDPLLWSQVTSNAVRMSGPTDAAAIVQHVYDNVPDGYLAYNAVHQVIAALVGRDYLAVPSRESVRLAWKLFELHRIKGGDRGLYLRPGTLMPGTLMPLVSAFMADINIPERQAAVEILCRYTEDKKLVQQSQYDETWAGTAARLAALRCGSHIEALEAVLAEPDGSLSEGDLRSAFGFITTLRYADATTAPITILPMVLDFARGKGFSLDQYYAWTYVRSITSSILRLYADMGAGLKPLISSEISDRTIPDQHMFQALVAIREVERLYRDPECSFTSDERLASAILSAYSTHDRASDDRARFRSSVPSVATARTDVHGVHGSALGLLRGARTYKELKEVWRVLSNDGMPQNTVLRCHYAVRLLRLGRFYAAIEFARHHIPDNPNEPEVIGFMARLLTRTEDTKFRLDALEVLPITADDPRTREAVNKVVAHRRGLGLKQKIHVSDI